MDEGSGELAAHLCTIGDLSCMIPLPLKLMKGGSGLMVTGEWGLEIGEVKTLAGHQSAFDIAGSVLQNLPGPATWDLGSS